MLERTEIIDGLKAAASWSGFAASLVRTYTLRGDLTHSQWASADGMVAKLRANADRKNREGADIDASRIEALLATAAAGGLKAPKFRADGLTFSIAGAASRNAGAVYVKGGGVYFGKISGGRFSPSRDAAAGTGEAVARIAADPTAAAVAYGRLTGSCACCGRTLSDPASVALGIGPICAERWGL